MIITLKYLSEKVSTRAKGAKFVEREKVRECAIGNIIRRFQRWIGFCFSTGQLAQAVIFRAFGADSREFSHSFVSQWAQDSTSLCADLHFPLRPSIIGVD